MATINHNVTDNIAVDHLFVIDPITRLITNEAGKKQNLIQYDHNSERFTFSVPATIEGHDMTKCDHIIIHAINIDGKTRLTSEEEYEVDDMTSDDDKGIVNFSWLISNRCTQYAGTLSFLVSFVCTDEKETPIYVWNTAPCKAFNVLEGMNNSNNIEKEHADILLKWKAEIQSFKLMNLEQTQEGNEENGGENIWTATFEGLEEKHFKVKNGAAGITPLFRINEVTSYWEVSYDKGETWESTGRKSTGASAYEVAVANGYEGTEEDWVNENIYPKFYKDGLLVKKITFSISGNTLSINTET